MSNLAGYKPSQLVDNTARAVLSTLILLALIPAGQPTRFFATRVEHVLDVPIPRTVACAANASAPERYAAEELARFLRLIAPPVSLMNATPELATKPQLAVGYGAARLIGIPASKMTNLSREGYVLERSASGTSLALSGGSGAPRGTLYAVNEFLEALGVQFLAADVTVLPAALPPSIPSLRPRYVPQLEYRQTYGYQMIDAPDFNVHLRLNKGHFNDPTPELNAAHGGVYPVYASPPGDAHTSYALLPGGADRGLHGPPPQLWASHRQWFWPQADNASDIYGQLCWSNRSLQAFLVSRVRGFLKMQPEATMISVSQNDNGEMCETAEELAIVREEGGAKVGPMLRAINVIADAIREDFPDVSIGTLAYGDTSSPPITEARPNVMIQLAPISADYGRPLSSRSNKPIRDQIVAWGRKSSRLFVWNYVGGFECFLLPFPNYYALAADIQFLARNGVTGIFNEASYVGPGGDFAEHNQFVVSKMMWEPGLNGSDVSAGFLRGYYSEAAAFHVKQYMDILTQRMLALDYYMQLAGWEMTVYAPIFDVATVVRAGTALQAAVHAAYGANDSGKGTIFAHRVEKSSLSLYWVVIHRYGELRFGAKQLSMSWPFQATNAECFKNFERLWNMSSARTTEGLAEPGLGEGDTRSLADLRDENLRMCPNGVVEGQLITLFNGGIRNTSGVRGPEVIASAVNASSFGEQHCAPAQAGLPACHYTFTVLGHWVSALAPTPVAPQWIEWEFSLRPGMGIGQVQALQLPSADGVVQHQLLFDGTVVARWARRLVVDAAAVTPARFCQVVYSAVMDCANTSNASTCNSNPPLSWAMPSVPVKLSPQPAALSARTQGCRRDLLFEFMPASESVAVSKARLLTTQAPGAWVAWSTVSFTMCPLPLRGVK